MRESIKVIKCCGCISLLFLILTYLVSVNIEGNFIKFNTVWISNSFWLTLFGGVFASMLVVVLCEIQKYLSTKANAEQFIFFQALYLFQALEQMRVIVVDYLDYQELQVTENLFDESIRIYEGVFFLRFYKEAERIYFCKKVITIRERGRNDSVSKETLRTNTSIIQREITAKDKLKVSKNIDIFIDKIL